MGVDFGLKSYLTLSDGIVITNPQFLKKHLASLRKASQALSSKRKGSHHREQARLALCREHERITNARKDFQLKLAHALCKAYDLICIEDLNLQGMSRLWGRRMLDLAHGEFTNILLATASKYGVTVHKIDKWYPSSKMCDCGYKHAQLALSEREWVCPHCGQVHDRDVHAAKNILRRGIYELGSGSKTTEATASRQSTLATQESHVL